MAEVFANYGRYWAESLRLPSLPAPKVVAGVKTVGFEHVETALAAGRGVIVAAPHLGGWEWGAMYLVDIGLPVTVAVEALEPADLFEWFVGFRERLGMQRGPGRATGRSGDIAGVARKPHRVPAFGPAGGRDGRYGGVLFRRTRHAPGGPGDAGHPVGGASAVGGHLLREVGFLAHAGLPATDRPPGGRPLFRETVQAGTQSMAHELETLIRRAPTQWHLLQPNWPDDARLRNPWPWARSSAAATAPTQPSGGACRGRVDNGHESSGLTKPVARVSL